MDAWVQNVVDSFFRKRRSPTREECNERALSLLGNGAKSLRPVGTPGSLSYTVIGNSSVISSRQEASRLDEDITKLARQIHGDLAPTGTYHGMISDAKLQVPLSIYSMPLLPGSAILNVLGDSQEMDGDEEGNHTRFVRDLAE